MILGTGYSPPAASTGRSSHTSGFNGIAWVFVERPQVLGVYVYPQTLIIKSPGLVFPFPGIVDTDTGAGVV